MKKIFWITAASVAAILILSLSLFFLLNPKEDETADGAEEIADIDLESFSIAELTDAQIVGIDGKCRASVPKFTRSGSNSGITDVKFADEDRDTTVYSTKNIVGIKTVSATLVKDSIIKLKIDSTLVSGDAEVVIIANGEILERFDAGSKKSFEFSVTGESVFYVRILCENANIEITTEREFKKAQ